MEYNRINKSRRKGRFNMACYDNEMSGFRESKSFRLLDIYERMNKGEWLSKKKLIEMYGVSYKTIERDIADLRAYFQQRHASNGEAEIIYDVGYYYIRRSEKVWLTNKEILAICKVLLESRAFTKKELNDMLDKLLFNVTEEGSGTVKRIISNEKLNYIPMRHKKQLLDPIWALSEEVLKRHIIEIAYERQDGTARIHKVKPVSIMFSEYYFYLIAFMADDSKRNPTVFRVDRISHIKDTGKTFRPFKDRYEESEFRKCVQFMYSGELHRVTFLYKGENVDSVLDRLPTAEIIEQKDCIYKIKVRAYGNGIYMWLDSQGGKVEILE